MSLQQAKEVKLPGDLPSHKQVEAIIRVDHAGEYGAKRIYEGQIEGIQNTECQKELEHMLEQELQHLEYFDQSIKNRRIRPTIFMPLWHVLGKLIGKVTAKAGKESAMACTVAVEDVIEGHYKKQINLLKNSPETELKSKITQFREEELEHRDIGLDEGAQQAPSYNILYNIIQKGSKAAIWLSKRF